MQLVILSFSVVTFTLNQKRRERKERDKERILFFI